MTIHSDLSRTVPHSDFLSASRLHIIISPGVIRPLKCPQIGNNAQLFFIRSVVIFKVEKYKTTTYILQVIITNT